MKGTFEWDPRKASINIAKLAVWFEEATTVFGDPFGRIKDDPRHSADEERYVLLGASRTRKLLAVMFVERGQGVRIISARRPTGQERKEYEENSPES